MHILAGIVGFAMIFIILGDAFETITLPRRVTRNIRLTRLFYRYTWISWRILLRRLRNRKRKEALLGYFGPLSLIVLLQSWAVALILGFALLQWAWGARLHGNAASGFATALYFSGTTFMTLGLGDLVPASTAARILTVWEAGTGFGFLAIVIGYLPVIYQAFSRREATISLLDARGGSPPSAVEILRRHAEAQALGRMDVLLLQFDHWSAELLESHISYPVLTLFRSQHSNESWLAALTAILDLCALLMVGIEGTDGYQAQLTFAMARHAVVDLAQVLSTPPLPPVPERLPPPEFERLCRLLQSYRAPLREGPAAASQLAELRRMYEPYVNALGDHLVLGVPGWFPRDVPDNWQTSAWENAARRISRVQPALPDDHI
jgi:voltage-gated potassium channel Kch